MILNLDSIFPKETEAIVRELDLNAIPQRINDDSAKELLQICTASDMIIGSMLDDKQICELLLYLYTNPHPSNEELFGKLVRFRMTDGVLTYTIYFVQTRPEKDITEFAVKLLSGKDNPSFFICLWKRILKSERPEYTAARYVYSSCGNDTIAYADLVRRAKFLINSDFFLQMDNIYQKYLKGDYTDMNESDIIRAEVEYPGEGVSIRAIYECKNGISVFKLPYPDDSNIILYGRDGESQNKMDLREFKSVLKADYSKDICYHKYPLLFHDGTPLAVCESYNDSIPSGLVVTDATENIMLGYPVLSDETINSKDNGLWSHYGKRLLVIKLVRSEFRHESDNESSVASEEEIISSQVVWKKIGDADAMSLYSYPVTICNDVIDQFLCELDTNGMGEVIRATCSENDRVRCEMCFEIQFKSPDSDVIKKYEIPFYLYMNNCYKSVCLNKNDQVSIDFGTSSTCVAIDDGSIKMVTLAPDNDGKDFYNIYENPTNLKIYSWEELCELWCKNKHPILRRKSSDEYSEKYKVSFEFGHFNMDLNKRHLDAMISKLKMIPKLISEGRETRFIPYDEQDKEVMLSIGKNDNRNFDPVEFYGYLIGCAINHPNNVCDKYYSNYHLTFPVKFSPELREKMRSSIEKGIIRSLPWSVLGGDSKKSPINIQMEYAEPMACVGAACGYELRITDGRPVLFGVFDFGGGTLDFTFGLYRNADEDTEGYEEAIEFLGDGGDSTFGGENLISRISYWILTAENNKNTIIKNNIVIERPSDETIPDGYGDLINYSNAAHSNITTVSEKISERYFKGETIHAVSGEINPNIDAQDGQSGNSERYDGSHEVVFAGSLINRDGIEISEEIRLQVNFDEINDRLNGIITTNCNVFKSTMDACFAQPYSKSRLDECKVEYNAKEVVVLLAGNASKYPTVQKKLEEIFDPDNVRMIGENHDIDKKVGNRYRVTPKTAVAIGQLKLSGMLIRMPQQEETETLDLFGMYIAKSSGAGGKKLLLKRNDSDRSWKRVGPVRNGSIYIYYSSFFQENKDDIWHSLKLDSLDNENNRICFIRMCGKNEIEYTTARLGEQPDDSSEIIRKTIII